MRDRDLTLELFIWNGTNSKELDEWLGGHGWMARRDSRTNHLVLENRRGTQEVLYRPRSILAKKPDGGLAIEQLPPWYKTHDCTDEPNST